MVVIGIGFTLLLIVLFLPMAGIHDTKSGFVAWILMAVIATALLLGAQ